MLATHVALLRGINVGGKNKLAMRELVASFEKVGASNVRTYIQSGNVVFDSSPSEADALASRVSAMIEARLGFRAPMVVRTIDDLRRILRDNPFIADGEPDTWHVVFLSDRPAEAAVASLDPNRSPPDRFVAHDREIFMKCPAGVGRTKLTNDWFDRQLGVVSTMRNWRTVIALVDLGSR